ncbi:unnamed protein product [Symbiodinium sp. CCMP2456]|nr:unnamed protein product [Symbiodinium sp. CCMP2456]
MSLLLVLLQLLQPQATRLATEASVGLPQNYSSFLQAFGLLERRLKEGPEMWKIREEAFWSRHTMATKQNRDPERRWVAAASHLFDATEAEMKEMTGYTPKTSASMHKALGFLHIQSLPLPENLALPQDVDWRQHTPTSNFVRTQGSCGSCWAVASANALEMHAELNGHGSAGVAYEEILSCTPNTRHCGGDGGCSGATAELAFQYVKDSGVVMRTPEMAAGGVWGERCGMQPGQRIWTDGFVRVTPNLAQPLVQAIAMQGPVVVSADATNWETYSYGIFDSCSKDARVNHAVLAVGYGQSASGKYFLIRNSWGGMWGEQGHIRLLRFDDGPGPSPAFCGTDYHPEEGVACQGETRPVKVCGMCGILLDSAYPLGVRVESSTGERSSAQKM